MSIYKWCICDMDGTLLNSEGNISEENENALKKLQSSGMEVMIASGRVELMLKQFINQLKLKGYVISCNGGLIRNIDTGEIIYSNTMDKNVVKTIITNCLDENIDFHIYTDDLIYSNKNNPRLKKYDEWNENVAKSLQFTVKNLDKASLDIIENLNILKVLLVCSSHSQIELLQERYSKINNLTVVSSSIGLLDIMASNTSKGKALKFLSDKLNVSLEHVIAFGDNYNDIDMLQSVGMPVAMENSVEELKVEAKFITKSNDQSGIAYAIDSLNL